MNIRWYMIAAAGMVTLSLLFGCADTGPKECICTTEFRSLGVYIQDGSHQAIDSLITISTNRRTGRQYTSQEGDLNPYATPGHYVVLTDAATNDLRIAGDTILFHAQNSRHTFDQVYVIGTDDCRCHIRKVAGPDTLTER